MAEVVAGVGTSHTPAIGAAIDHGKTDEEYWQPVFAGYERARAWIAEVDPDVAIVVYNDHASAFSLEVIPTFALGVAPSFSPADEGYGPRPVPQVPGDPDLAWHLAETLILDGFDLTLCNEMPVDHGLTVPMSIMFGQPEQWPCKVIPLHVNMIQYPPPTGQRCYDLGRAIRRAIGSFEGERRVAIFGTGGMSHQLQGERAGLVNPEFDAAFLDQLGPTPEALVGTSHTEYIRLAGSEGMELIMWFIMRGALSEEVVEAHRHYHVAASNTAVGLIAYDSQ